MLKKTYRLELALAREALKRFINHKDVKTYMPLGGNFERTDWLVDLNKDYFLARSVIEGTGIFAYATDVEILAARMLLRICKYQHLCEAIAREDFADFPSIPTGEHEKTARRLEAAIDSYLPGLCKIMGKYELLAAVSPNKVTAEAEDQGETKTTPKQQNPQIDKIKKFLDNVQTRAVKQGNELNLDEMPGQKKDLYAVWRKVHNGKQSLSTFNDWIKGLVKFKPGAVSTDFYQRLFPNYFDFDN